MMNPKFRVIISSDDNVFFFPFWPLVVIAWKKFFLECEVHLAFVTHEPGGRIAKELRKYGHVHIYHRANDMPGRNQGMMARHYLASSFADDVPCLIHDIDSLPLQSQYTETLLSVREPGHILAVGKEIYDGTVDEGKWPTSHMIADGPTFKKFFGFSSSSALHFWPEMMRFCDMGDMIDGRESINEIHFSDESLYRLLVRRRGCPPIQHIWRQLDINDVWLDRSWWKLDMEKLKTGGYIECNMPRPAFAHFDKLKPVFDFFGFDWSETWRHHV